MTSPHFRALKVACWVTGMLAWPSTSRAEDKEVTVEATAEATTTTTTTAKPETPCADGHRFCLYGGAFLASFSITGMVGGGHSQGETSHRLLSVVVPVAGARLALGSQISLDLGAFTALISEQLKTDASDQPPNSGCSKNSSRFVSELPCEGNAVLRPYIATYLGLSVGSDKFSALTFAVTMGYARTAHDPTARLFGGIMLGVGGLHGTIAPFEGF